MCHSINFAAFISLIKNKCLCIKLVQVAPISHLSYLYLVVAISFDPGALLLALVTGWEKIGWTVWKEIVVCFYCL